MCMNDTWADVVTVNRDCVQQVNEHFYNKLVSELYVFIDQNWGKTCECDYVYTSDALADVRYMPSLFKPYQKWFNSKHGPKDSDTNNSDISRAMWLFRLLSEQIPLHVAGQEVSSVYMNNEYIKYVNQRLVILYDERSVMTMFCFFMWCIYIANEHGCSHEVIHASLGRFLERDRINDVTMNNVGQVEQGWYTRVGRKLREPAYTGPSVMSIMQTIYDAIYMNQDHLYILYAGMFQIYITNLMVYVKDNHEGSIMHCKSIVSPANQKLYSGISAFKQFVKDELLNVNIEQMIHDMHGTQYVESCRVEIENHIRAYVPDCEHKRYKMMDLYIENCIWYLINGKVKFNTLISNTRISGRPSEISHGVRMQKAWSILSYLLDHNGLRGIVYVTLLGLIYRYCAPMEKLIGALRLVSLS